MFIPDPGLKRSRIRIKELKYFYPQFSKIRSEMFIPDLVFFLSWIPYPDPGSRVKKASDPGSATLHKRMKFFFYLLRGFFLLPCSCSSTISGLRTLYPSDADSCAAKGCSSSMHGSSFNCWDSSSFIVRLSSRGCSILTVIHEIKGCSSVTSGSSFTGIFSSPSCCSTFAITISPCLQKYLVWEMLS
jgi:hypothetical protein